MWKSSPPKLGGEAGPPGKKLRSYLLKARSAWFRTASFKVLVKEPSRRASRVSPPDSGGEPLSRAFGFAIHSQVLKRARTLLEIEATGELKSPRRRGIGRFSEERRTHVADVICEVGLIEYVESVN